MTDNEEDEDGQEYPVDDERREGVRLNIAQEVADAEEPRYCRRDEPLARVGGATRDGQRQ